MELFTAIEKPKRELILFNKLVETGDYFKEMDHAIQNSPTATMAVLMFKKYCVLPNLKDQFSDLWGKIIDEKIKYGYFTLWIEYDIDLNVKSANFRLSKNYRAKRIDDMGNVAQYLNVITGKKFPSFNPDKKVLKSQIKEAGGFEKFSGQIFQYNTTSQPYEITPLFSVYDWMKVEHDTPMHIGASADNALFGNNIFLMKKGAESSDSPENTPKVISNTDRVIGALRAAKGTKNSGTNHVITVDTEEDLTKVFTKTPIGNEIDLDKFNSVDDKAGKKICTACYCFPQILANPSEGLFGNSGDAMTQAINYWRTTCEFEAEKINMAFEKIGLNILDIVETTNNEEISNVDQTVLDAQAALRGSVGGVQALLSIQNSYSQKLTTRESAIAMIELIFGFTKDNAERLLGAPIIETEPLPMPIINPVTPSAP